VPNMVEVGQGGAVSTVRGGRLQKLDGVV
jgi:hypothetical protein